MIKIEFKRQDGNIVSYEVNGHAEYEAHSEVVYDDVVCGVVSNLAQVTILGVNEILKLSADYAAEDGHIALDVSNKSKEDIEKCQILLETMLLGLRNLEISYSKYIKVTEKEVQ